MGGAAGPDDPETLCVSVLLLAAARSGPGSCAWVEAAPARAQTRRWAGRCRRLSAPLERWQVQEKRMGAAADPADMLRRSWLRQTCRGEWGMSIRASGEVRVGITASGRCRR